MARIINVSRETLGNIISLGHVGENDATEVNFSPTIFNGLTTSGFNSAAIGNFNLYMEQNGSSWEVPAADLSLETVDGNKVLHWVVGSTEVQNPGRGRVQIKFSPASMVEYSCLVECVVERSIDAITSANPQLAPVYIADILEGLRAALNAMPKPSNATNGNIAIFNDSREVIDSGHSVSDFAPKNTPILFAEDMRSSSSADFVLQLEDASVSQLTDGMLISFFTKYASAAATTITLMDHNGNNLCTNVPAYNKGSTQLSGNYLVAKQFATFRYFAVNPNNSQTSAFYLLTTYDANTTYPYIANGTGKGSGNTPSPTYDAKYTSVILGSTAMQVGSTWANVASGKCAIAEGGRRPNKTEGTTVTQYPVLTASGDYSHAEGASTQASGAYSHAQNKQSKACGESSTAMGASCVAGDENDSSKGTNALAAGELSVASGRTSIAMGGLCEATGNYAVAIGSGVTGQKNVASGPNSFALGFNNTASAEKSYAQGNSSEASGLFAFALGNTCKAGNEESFALGAGANANVSSGNKGGVAIGKNVEVTAQYGVALGVGLIPRQDANGNNIADTSIGRVVIGRYNEAPEQRDIISFGIGSVNSRKTALKIKASGDIVGCGATPADDNSLVSKKWVEENFYRRCLLKGTKILMANGTEKNIEDIEPGEEILSYNPTTQKLCTAIALSSYRTGSASDYTRYTFQNGSHLTVYYDHGYYEAKKGFVGGIKEITNEKFGLGLDLQPTRFLQKEVVSFYGINQDHYNLLSSNNLYFANGILCGFTPSKKKSYYSRIEGKLPEQIENIFNDDAQDYIDFVKALEDNEYQAEVSPYLVAYREAKRKVEHYKQCLASLDYQTIKYAEGLITEDELAGTVEKKELYRAKVNEFRPIYRENFRQVEVIKQKYRNGLDKRALFNQCCDRDNAALDLFREWLAPKQDVPAAEVTE